jgi:O-antigen biosynthesis protein
MPKPEVITPAGEILAAALIEDGLALLLGWTDRPLPESGMPIIDTATGTARTLSWPQDGGAGHWLVMVMETPEILRLPGAKAALLSPNGRLRFVLPSVARLALDWRELLAQLAPLGDAGRIVAFLRDVLLSGDSPTRPRHALLFDCLERMAEADGFVEIFGRADTATALIQGWSVRLMAGIAEIVVDADGFHPVSAAIATYDRADLGASARGVLLALPAAGLDLRRARRVFFRRGESWHRLEIFENRRFLGDAETTPHLKGLYPLLRLDAATAPLFKRLCGSRYEGCETVTTLTAPVRAALDLAVGVDGTGVFLTGWLLDPDHCVTSVSLRNGAGLCQRLDHAWVRTGRNDVSTGYGGDPLFAGRLRPGDDAHGFVVGVPCSPDLTGGWYLELVLNGEDFAFLPVPLTAPTPALIRQMLCSVNIFDPAAELVIARQLAPLVAASTAQAAPKRRSAVSCGFGPPPRRTAKVSAIVPLLRGAGDFDINLARFALDPEMEAVELVVVAPGGTAANLQRGAAADLQRHARFYGCSGRLIVSAEDLDFCDALELGAEAASAPLLLFLSPTVFPTAPGWVSRLAEAASNGAACPTLIYEDHSIKYAGARFSGYARHWQHATTAEPVKVENGTLECCMIPRDAFRALGGFARDYVGADLKGPDFFLRLRHAGLPCHWLPGVELTALDEPAEAIPPEYWRQTGKMVDAWAFQRKWAKSA